MLITWTACRSALHRFFPLGNDALRLSVQPSHAQRWHVSRSCAPTHRTKGRQTLINRPSSSVMQSALVTVRSSLRPFTLQAHDWPRFTRRYDAIRAGSVMGPVAIETMAVPMTLVPSAWYWPLNCPAFSPVCQVYFSASLQFDFPSLPPSPSSPASHSCNA